MDSVLGVGERVGVSSSGSAMKDKACSRGSVLRYMGHWESGWEI